MSTTPELVDWSLAVRVASSVAGRGPDTSPGVRAEVRKDFREFTRRSDDLVRDLRQLGTPIRVNGKPFSIVGVMPEGFAYPQNDRIWLPLQNDPLVGERGRGLFVSAIGKLKPRVTLDQASADLAVTAKRLAGDYKQLE